MNAIRIAGLVCALCLGLMLGLLFGGNSHAIALMLIGLGGALTLAICAWAEWQ